MSGMGGMKEGFLCPTSRVSNGGVFHKYLTGNDASCVNARRDTATLTALWRMPDRVALDFDETGG